MANSATNNKRIAKNTLLLYGRMILVLIISLYTSRVILSTLGIEDYGIYNVIGGVVSMFSFLNASMTTSTQRFLTFSLGKGDIKEVSRVFSVSLNIHIILGIAILLFAETFGLWFINDKLVIPPERLNAANIVYQTTVFALIVNIIQVPYNAIIIAYEKMNIYAYVSIVEVLLKLAIVYLLHIISFDKLAVYGILMLAVQILIRLIYGIYCNYNYPFCKFKLIKDHKLYKDLSSFAGWNLFGSLSWMFRGQGVNILLNIFCGPAVNAARGIAYQVNNAINNFVTNFQTALNPQITKQYAANAIEKMENLVFIGAKFSFFLLFMLALPIMINIDFILGIWLKEIPEYTNIFVILILIDSLISCLFSGPLMTSLSATGNIKKYQIVVSSIIITTFPLSWIYLKLGGGPTSVFIVSIFITLAAGIARFVFCKLQIGFSAKRFINYVILPVILVAFLAPVIPVLLIKTICDISEWSRLILLTVVSVISTVFFIWIIGINHSERQIVYNNIQKIIAKIQKR